MKQRVLAFLLLGSLAACKENNPVPAPSATADFSFRGDRAIPARLATGDTCSLFVHAPQYPASVSWDLGNGTKTTARRPVVAYDKPGTYTVKLVIANSEGRQRTITRQVQVVDLVLKRVVIKRAYWKPLSLPNFNVRWPASPTANLYVQIQQLQPSSTFLPGGLVTNAPVVFKSAVAPDVFWDTQAPITLPLTSRVVLNRQRLAQAGASGYVVSLLAEDATGTYCLVSNMFSGVNTESNAADVRANPFVYSLSLFSAFTLEGAYE